MNIKSILESLQLSDEFKEAIAPVLHSLAREWAGTDLEWREVWSQSAPLDEKKHIEVDVIWNDEQGIGVFRVWKITNPSAIWRDPPVLLWKEAACFNQYTEAILWGQESWETAYAKAKEEYGTDDVVK